MALYHTHRPQDFGSVVGQEHIVKTLSNQILAGTVAHAYLFFGPRGIGKTTTARLLAKSMNCTERKKDSAEPCNACASCLEIGRGSALDVIEIDAASHTGVDNVRENIIDNAQFRPTKSAYKVFIIDEVHMLSTSAFNALLKTLEEPPQHVLFILATTELHKLPDTIVSRCQRFTFSKIPSDALKAHLAHIASSLGVTCEESVLNHIVQKSEGCARDAISLLEQVMATGEKHITAASAAFLLPPSAAEEVVALTTAIVHGETHTALQTIQHLYDQGFQFLQFTDDCIAFLRTLLIAQVTPQYIDTLALEAATKKSITELSSSLTQKKLIALIEAFFDARAQLRQTPMPQLPLEILAVAQTQTDPMSASPVSTPLPPGAALPTQKAIPATPPPATDTVQMEENTPLPASEEPKKQSLAKKVKALVSHKSIQISLEDARKKWPEFIQVLEKDSPALTFILKLAELHEVNGNTFVIAVGHQFHRDKLNEKHCMQKIESMLAPIYGGNINLNIVLKDKKAIVEKKQELDSLASAFGGEVVA